MPKSAKSASNMKPLYFRKVAKAGMAEAVMYTAMLPQVPNHFDIKQHAVSSPIAIVENIQSRCESCQVKVANADTAEAATCAAMLSPVPKPFSPKSK